MLSVRIIHTSESASQPVFLSAAHFPSLSPSFCLIHIISLCAVCIIMLVMHVCIVLIALSVQ